MRALIVAGGEPPRRRILRRLARAHDLVLAADSGAATLLAAGLLPGAVIGDYDSLPPEAAERLAAAGVPLLPHPAPGLRTDGHVALLEARRRGADHVTITGVLAPRLDQAINHVLLLALPELESAGVCLLGRHAEAWLVRGEKLVRGRPGDYVSLLPLSETAEGVTTTGLLYPLRGARLLRADSLGVSNRLVEPMGGASVEHGLLLLVHETGDRPAFPSL